MAYSPATRALEARLTAEFRADWASRESSLDLSIRQASSRLAAQGNARSGALIDEHARLYEQALEDARSVLVARAATLLAAQKPRAIPDQESLRSVIGAELDRLATDWNQRLADQQRNIGINLNRSVQAKRKALGTTLESELEHAVAEARKARDVGRKQWFERPVGIVALGAAASVVAWLVTNKACGK